MDFFLGHTGGSGGGNVHSTVACNLDVIVVCLTLNLAIATVTNPDALGTLDADTIFGVVLFLLLTIFTFSFFK